MDQLTSEQVDVLVVAILVVLLCGGAVCWRARREFNRQYDRYKFWIERGECGEREEKGQGE